MKIDIIFRYHIHIHLFGSWCILLLAGILYTLVPLRLSHFPFIDDWQKIRRRKAKHRNLQTILHHTPAGTVVVVDWLSNEQCRLPQSMLYPYDIHIHILLSQLSVIWCRMHGVAWLVNIKQSTQGRIYSNVWIGRSAQGLCLLPVRMSSWMIAFTSAAIEWIIIGICFLEGIFAFLSKWKISERKLSSSTILPTWQYRMHSKAPPKCKQCNVL